MTGNNRVNFILQDRDRKLLNELGLLRVIDREQAKVVAGFGSTTRANARLLTLTRAGLLRSFFVGTIAGGRRAVYTLSPRGASVVDAPLRGIRRSPNDTLSADNFLEHQLRINEIYLSLKRSKNSATGLRLVRWTAPREALSKASPIIPDAYFEVETPNGFRAVFLEVDRGTMPLRRWRTKTRNYLQFALSGDFSSQFGHERFRVLVVAPSNRRVETIRKAIAKFTTKVFWLASFEVITAEGFLSSVWLRPGGEQHVQPF